MSRSVTFHTIERYSDDHIRGENVTLSFKTRRAGIYQVTCVNTGLSEFSTEPSIQIFTKKDQEYIKTVSYIVYRVIFNVFPESEP